jgi:hypothetical protein
MLHSWLKTSLKLTLVIAAAAAVQVGFVNPAQATTDIRKSQVHVRTGILSGSYKGTFSGEFEVTSALDFDFEMFIANTTSVLFRFLQGLDSDSRPYYTYAGSGMRYFFDSKGTSADQSEGGLSIVSRPRIRTYLGGDLGVAQVIVRSFGPNVQSVANMLDVGANLGAIWQINDNLGLEVHVGKSVGYGMSSTPQNGDSTRYFIGGSYFF